MRIEVRGAEYPDVEPMRGLYRQELNCQIIHDSFLGRGLSDAYLILVDGRRAGYGAISNKYGKGRLNEFYTTPQLRSSALPMFRELLAASGATHIEAQTNSPLMLLMLFDCGKNIVAENILFHDGLTTNLNCPTGVFRQEKDGWAIESNGMVVATGGILCHYNPPYGDIHMDVVETARRQGFGSYIVQELKRACYETGKKPAARCNADNIASRRTLEKAGMLPCGRLLVGEVQ